MLLLGRRPIAEVTKVLAELYFLFIFDFPGAIAFLYILVAVHRVSHNSIAFPKFGLSFQWE